MGKDLFAVLYNNRIVLLGMLCGLIAGYLYWHYFACCWGIYALSAECWVNCTLGALGGGFITCVIRERNDN